MTSSQEPRTQRSQPAHGLKQLAESGIIGVTDLVESLHSAIINLSAITGSAPKRTTGITGQIYRNIRNITQWVGTGLDEVLEPLVPLLKGKEPSPGLDGIRSALNGILGDHLAEKNNPLAIPMQLNKKGAPLGKDYFRNPQTPQKILILVHGLCMNDRQWQVEDHNHGGALSADLGFDAIYLRYNTGRHISENGENLSVLLEQRIGKQSRDLDIYLVAHSMGGLVSRSACDFAARAGHGWLTHVRKMVFLGTPHHGAPLERVGNLVGMLLKTTAYSAPFARLPEIRSSGITDLRYGYVAGDDWKNKDRFQHTGDRRTPVPLPTGVDCYTIAGSFANEKGQWLRGDNLVPVASALGQHKNPALHLNFPESHQWIGRNINHFDLLNHPEVYQHLKKWLGP